MGVDVNVIFQIAGVGIVVAFYTRYWIRWARKNTLSG